MKRTLKDSLRLNLDDLLKMKRTDLESVYRQLNAVTQRRIATFKKHGAIDASAIKNVKGLPKSPRRFNKREMAREIFNQQLFLQGDTSSYAAYKRQEREFRKLMELRTGLTFRSAKQARGYAEFMKDIAARYPETTKEYYGIARRLYQQVQRLNLNSNLKTFKNNFEYWAEQVEKLEAVPDSEIRKGKKYTSLSSLAEQLDLPKIRDYEKGL